MGLKIYSIGSSSSGNSYIVQSGSTSLLLDVGLSGKKIKEGIAEVGASLADVQGILVTHEHVDHVKSIRMMARNCSDAEIIASHGTMMGCENFAKVEEERLRRVSAGDKMTIGDIEIETFALSHDANEPVSYTFRNGGDTLAVVTDTGIVTDEIFEQVTKANKLVFEANHEEDLLLMGPYPYSVKRRILSNVGHLSNVTSGEMLSKIFANKKYDEMPKVMLAHLSSQNNTPSQAEWTVTERLAANGYEPNRDYRLDIALKEGLSVLE